MTSFSVLFWTCAVGWFWKALTKAIVEPAVVACWSRRDVPSLLLVKCFLYWKDVYEVVHVFSWTWILV